MFPVSPVTIPLFKSENDRDRRYAEWVAAGNRLVRGMFCGVNARFQTFDGDRWVNPTERLN